MKKKTINAILCGKFNKFLASITDEAVRKLVEENSIITGGCITSLLLNEDVSDFDIYFRNRDTAFAVSEYYLKLFKEAQAKKHAGKSDYVDVPMYVEEKDGRIKLVIKSAGIASSTNPGGYKYFEGQPDAEGEKYVREITRTLENLETVPGDDLPESVPFQPSFISTNAFTLTGKVQLIVRFYGEPDQIHETYDFVHCTNYWTSWDKEVVLRQEALEAILAKELRYIGSKYPLCSIIRTRKFIKRGWTINAGQYLKMCLQLQSFDLLDVNVLEDQLVGVDTAYFVDLIERIKAKDPEKTVDAAYITTIIDRLF